MKRVHLISLGFWMLCAYTIFLGVTFVLPSWHRPVDPHAQVQGCDPNKPRTIEIPTGVHTAFSCPTLISVENMDASGDRYKITIYPVEK